MVRLNFRYRGEPVEGYEDIDVSAQLEFPSHIEPQSAEEVRVSHVLDYVPPESVALWLARLSNILKVGGVMTIRAADLDKMIECYKSGLWSGEAYHRLTFGRSAFSAGDLIERVRRTGVQPTHLVALHENITADPETTAIPAFELRSTQGVVIGWGPDGSGLGDLIMLTPICAAIPNVVVQIPTRSQRFACLFDGLAKVQVVDPPVKTPHTGQGHYVQMILRTLGKADAPLIPRINVNPAEVEAAREFLKPFKNPLILTVNCAARWKQMREFDSARWQEIVDQIKDRYTILQTGIRDNFTPLRDTIPLLDLPIPRMATIYHLVGKYIGVDTGDLYLTTATGGRAIAVVPPSNPYYEHKLWHLTAEHWRGERPRIMYLPVERMKTIPQQLSFLEE